MAKFPLTSAREGFCSACIYEYKKIRNNILRYQTAPQWKLVCFPSIMKNIYVTFHHTQKNRFFPPFHAWIWFKFWPNFGEGPPRICLIVEREEAQRYSWREAGSIVQIYPQSDPRIQLQQSLNFPVGRLVFMIILQCVCGEYAYHSAQF